MPWYIAIPLVIYILADITQYLLGLIFLSNVYTKLPVIKRNFAHLMMNVGEIVMGFGVLYLYIHAVGTNGIPLTSGIDATYFSMVTFSTIWYGDIIPLTQAGRVLVIIETLVSLLFVTIIVSSFVAGMDIKDEA
jgi:voltage-gated potassium channel Kch